jgi:ornithine cyclodeaminase/alanine dehydrogenase-like protein (mu-crystallin family)
MSLHILSSADVDAVVSTFTPMELQNLMGRVFYAISHPGLTSTCNPHRITVPITQHEALFMPAHLSSDFPSPALTGSAVKVVSVPTDLNDKRGLPASTIVLDESTGAVKAVINAKNLTALRNAAGTYASFSLIL